MTTISDIPLRDSIREKLEAAADPAYREFHSRLLPGTEGILGVRTPDLRRLAKELVRSKDGAWKEYIDQLSTAWRRCEPVLYDEKIIWALSICGGCSTWQQAEAYIAGFIPVIDNWAVCDIFCGSLKQAQKSREEAWQFLMPYFRSDGQYELRFGVVMLLSHFTGEEYVDQALAILDGIRHEGYYVKMAVAWAISVYFVKHPQKTMSYLKNSSLDNWTYNKALQKITESYRVDKDTKQQIRRMKR